MTKPLCLCCGSESATVSIDLDPSFNADSNVFNCDECRGIFSLAEVERVIATWGEWLTWLKQHPGYTPAKGT